MGPNETITDGTCRDWSNTLNDLIPILSTAINDAQALNQSAEAYKSDEAALATRLAEEGSVGQGGVRTDQAEFNYNRPDASRAALDAGGAYTKRS
jgi:hypothetical protein